MTARSQPRARIKTVAASVLAVHALRHLIFPLGGVHTAPPSQILRALPARSVDGRLESHV